MIRHVQGHFDEVGSRWRQRLLVGSSNRTTRKGRLTSQKVWDRIQPSLQMIELLAAGSGRRIRPTRNSSVAVLSGGRQAAVMAASSPQSTPVPSATGLGDDFIPF